jgi:mono/diheme cytochrome c family protein
MRSIFASAVLACSVIAVMRAAPPDPPVSAVSGRSWLHVLGVDYRDTNLGRGAGRYGPSPEDLAAERKPVSITLGARATITGAELYRLNCQACHRAEGTGAPPEIKSVLPAVQGSTLKQMRGTVTKADLYTRIEKGGQRMPARAHLQRADVDVLFGYLTKLAGARGAPAPASESVTADRLGELVVKGTCHICHDASGARPNDQAMLQGAIPSLAVIMTDKTIGEFVTKVERGAVTVMGTAPFAHRGRMPVFYYLTDNEVAAAYMYLKRYPPKP